MGHGGVRFADLAIVGAPSEVELPPRLSVVPFASHPFEVIFPVGHPLGKVRKMGLCDILRYPLILAAEDSSARLQFDHVVGEAGLPSQVNVVMTAGKVPSILNYVGLGMDVAVLTRSAIEAISFPAVKKERAKEREQKCLSPVAAVPVAAQTHRSRSRTSRKYFPQLIHACTPSRSQYP